MVNPIDIFDLLSDTEEGRRVGFETFLERFVRPRGRVPGAPSSGPFVPSPPTGPQPVPLPGLGAPAGQPGVARRNVGLVGEFNRPFFSNLFGQAQNEFFGNQGTRIQNEQDPLSFTDFLNNDFDLGRRTRRAPTSQTGRGTSRFVSPARFLFNQ